MQVNRKTLNESYDAKKWGETCVWHDELYKFMPYAGDSYEERGKKMKELIPLVEQLEEHSLNLVKSKLFDQCMQPSQRLLHTPLSGAVSDTFVAQGLVGSMCRDVLVAESNENDLFLYGGVAPADDFAAKNAGCSLLAASAYFSVLTDNNGPCTQHVNHASLSAPLHWLVDQFGFRFYFSVLVPVINSPILYGSSFEDPICNKNGSVHSALLSAGRVLHIASSNVSSDISNSKKKSSQPSMASNRRGSLLSPTNAILSPTFENPKSYIVEIATGINFDVREGDDGKKHIMDYRDSLPSEETSCCQHLPIVGHSQSFRAIRPELLVRWRDNGGPAVNPNTNLANKRTLFEESQESEVRAVSLHVTLFLTGVVVPEFARELSDSDLDLQYSLYDNAKLVFIAHRRGINIRHFGLLRSLLTKTPRGVYFKNLIFIEMVARVIKCHIREEWRLLVKNHHNYGVLTDLAIKTVVVKLFNDLLNPGRTNSGFRWMQLQKSMTEKFGLLSWSAEPPGITKLLSRMVSASEKEVQPDFLRIPSTFSEDLGFSRGKDSRLALFQLAIVKLSSILIRAVELLHIKLRPDSLVKLEDWQSRYATNSESKSTSEIFNFEFSSSDVVAVNAVVKHMPSFVEMMRSYASSNVTSAPLVSSNQPVQIGRLSIREKMGSPHAGGYNIIDLEDISGLKVQARGNFGSILIGEYNNTRVAVKFNEHDNSSEAMLREFQPSFAIGSHPNVIRAIGIVIDSARHVYGLAYEYALNGGLLNFIESRPVENTDRFCHIAGAMARGVAHMHSRNLVHRDIALRNFVVDDEENTLLCDFGLTRVLPAESGVYSLDKNSQSIPIFGSAPETLLQNIHVLASDVYMFGVAMWELLTTPPHTMPFHHARNQDGLLDLAQRDRLVLKLPPRFRGNSAAFESDVIPEWIHLLLEACLYPDYTKRPSMDQIIFCLDNRNFNLNSYVAPKSDHAPSTILEVRDKSSSVFAFPGSRSSSIVRPSLPNFQRRSSSGPAEDKAIHQHISLGQSLAHSVKLDFDRTSSMYSCFEAENTTHPAASTPNNYNDVDFEVNLPKELIAKEKTYTLKCRYSSSVESVTRLVHVSSFVTLDELKKTLVKPEVQTWRLSYLDLEDELLELSTDDDLRNFMKNLNEGGPNVVQLKITYL